MYAALMIFEIVLAVFAAWCMLNEDRLIEFEERTGRAIKRRMRNRKRERVAEYLAQNGLVAVPRLAENEDIIEIRK